jgi:hypothetical protein
VLITGSITELKNGLKNGLITGSKNGLITG